MKEHLKRIVKDESTLSVFKLATTSLTAITMSLVSTRLIGVVPSVILVGVLSIITALVSEIYRIIFEILQIKKRQQETVDEDSDKETPDAPEKGSNRLSETFSVNRGKRVKVSPALRLITLFLAICLTTIGTSYAVASTFGGNTTIVEKNHVIERKESISGDEKEEITNEAAIKANEKAIGLTNEKIVPLEDALATEKERTRHLSDQVDALNEKIAELERKIGDLESRPIQPNVPTEKPSPEPSAGTSVETPVQE